MHVIGRRSLAASLLVLVNVSWYFLAFVMALTVVLTLASPVIDLSGGEIGLPVSFTVDQAAVAVSAPAIGVAGARLEDARASLVFTPGSKQFLIGPLLSVLAMLAFGLWVLAELRGVFRTLRDGHPFVAANAARIRRIGWALILSEPVRAAMVYSANLFSSTNFSAPGLRFDARFDFNAMTIVHGAIVLVIAEVFRAGTRLDEEQSLTV